MMVKSTRSTLSVLTNPIAALLRTLARPVFDYFDQRLPRQDEHRFGRHNVYVFFSKPGWLFLLLLVLTFVTGVNYNNNLVLGFCFYLVSIWLVTAVMTHWQIAPLSVRLVNLSLAEHGGLIWIDIELSNTKARTSRQLMLYFNDPHIGSLADHEREIYATHQRAHLPAVSHAIKIRLPVVAHQRGQISLPRLTIKSVYPLGIIQAWTYVYFKSSALAYPKPLAFDWQIHKANQSSKDNESSPLSQAGQADFDTLDTYIEGENLGRVSWAHLARGAGMLTKRFADPVGDEWQLNYDKMPSSHHEAKLSELSYGVFELYATGEPFALVLPGDRPDSVPIGTGEAHLHACLLRLANAE